MGGCRAAFEAFSWAYGTHQVGGWHEGTSAYRGSDACGHLLYAVKVVGKREGAAGVVFTKSMPDIGEGSRQLGSLQSGLCGGGSLSQQW